LKEICDYLVEVELKIDLLCEKFWAQNAIRHKMLQFIPEMGWIATFLSLCSIKLAKHLII
jgi:hypothetical protein